MLLTAAAIAYVAVSARFVPADKWDWSSLLLFIPITLVLACIRAPVGWFIGIELFLSIIFFNVRGLFANRWGLSDTLEGWHVLLGAMWGLRLVAIQFAVYWLVKFIARNRTA